MNHIIQKQILDIHLPKKVGAIEQQEAIRSLYWDRVVPALDKAFSQIVPEGTTLRLESLSLDIGSVPFANIEKELVKQLTEQLTSIFQQTDPGKWEETVAGSESSSQQSDQDEKVPRIISKDPTEVKALFFFLKNGIFPWWFAQNHQKTPAMLLESLSPDQAKSFIRLVQKQGTPGVQKRLSGQFRVTQLLQFSERVSPDLARTLTTILKLLESLEAPFKNSSTGWQQSVDRALKETIVYGLTQFLSGQQVEAKLGDYAIGQLVVHSKIPENRLQLSVLEQLENKKLPGAQVLTKSLRSKRRKFKSATDKEGFADSTNPVVQPKARIKNVSNGSLAENTGKKEAVQKSNDTTPHKASKDSGDITQELVAGLFIENAGIVIVAPFLQLYFENLELIKDRQFTSLKEQERALLLLQYLVTGQVNRPENELILNKIITGWPLEEPVLLSIKLTEKEKKESDELLQSLIQHWGALGNSGIEALRETFLLRKGKLVEKEDQYQLLVERKSLDLLMERIPWSFSTIKLPWMEKRIQVEW